MHISFERRGGFAGMTIRAAFDVDELPQEQAASLKSQFEQAQFFQLPGQLTAKGGAADQFEYDISVEEEGQAHRVHISEGAAPETLRPALDMLTRLARTRARSK